jgi:hypothetical protein
MKLVFWKKPENWPRFKEQTWERASQIMRFLLLGIGFFIITSGSTVADEPIEVAAKNKQPTHKIVCACSCGGEEQTFSVPGSGCGTLDNVDCETKTGGRGSLTSCTKKSVPALQDLQDLTIPGSEFPGIAMMKKIEGGDTHAIGCRGIRNDVESLVGEYKNASESRREEILTEIDRLGRQWDSAGCRARYGDMYAITANDGAAMQELLKLRFDLE